MRPLLVVVADVLPEDSQEIAFAEDEDVVQTLLPDGFYEALGEGVRFGRSYRRANDAQALRAEHLIERP